MILAKNMQHTPLISVIIPTYNRADLLPRAVRSACEQTYTNLEILIVDDASSDNTEEVAKKLEQEDTRVRYIKREENGGGSAARNTGIKQSEGKYIALLDSDDEWFNEKIEKQLELLEKNTCQNIGLIYCGFIRKKNSETKSQFTPKHRCDISKDLLGKNVVGGCSGVLVKKECFDTCGLFDESPEIRSGGAQDYELWLRIAQKYSFDFIPQSLFFYYLHKQNMTKTNKALDRIRALEYISKKYSDLYKQNPLLFAEQLKTQGVTLLESGDHKLARRKFKESLKEHYDATVLLRYILAFSPRLFYHNLKNIKNILK